MKAARLMMVLSSLSPLFILWAIRGIGLVGDAWLISVAALMVALPNIFLWVRIWTAKRLNEKREIIVGTAEDHREHLLVYLFAMLLPFYTANLNTWREILSAVAALAFIVFLFWHLNLHYMNVFFAILGYRVFTIYPPRDDNPHTGKLSQVLITRRVGLLSGERIIAYRLSDSVYWEVDD
jgi:hypothetical protein